MFQEARAKVMEQRRQRTGIGTLSEKTTHAVLKHYLVPREEYHEIPCEGFVADIMFEGEIIEIQTANFNTLRRKLDVFLENHDVTVVYPIPGVKWVSWMDETTGEITKKRKSPKRGTYYHAFPELYKIKQYLRHPRLHFRFLLIDTEEYRLLNGWSENKKKGSSRFDRIPLDIEGELMLNSPEDFKKLVPDALPERFTSADYAKAARINKKQAQTALNILTYLAVVTRTGKKGNSILYESGREMHPATL